MICIPQASQSSVTLCLCWATSAKGMAAGPGAPSTAGPCQWWWPEQPCFYAAACLQQCSTTLPLWGLFVLQVQEKKGKSSY